MAELTVIETKSLMLVTFGTLSLTMTEYFGNLLNKGQLSVDSDGKGLIGSYRDVLFGFSIAIIVLCTYYLFHFMYNNRIHFKDKSMSRMKHTFRYYLSPLSAILGIVLSCMILNLIYEYGNVPNLTTNYDETKEKAKLRGAYGISTFVLSICVISLSSINLLLISYGKSSKKKEWTQYLQNTDDEDDTW